MAQKSVFTVFLTRKHSSKTNKTFWVSDKPVSLKEVISKVKGVVQLRWGGMDTEILELEFVEPYGENVMKLDFRKDDKRNVKTAFYPLWHKSGKSANNREYSFYSGMNIDLNDLRDELGDKISLTVFPAITKKSDKSPDASLLISTFVEFKPSSRSAQENKNNNTRSAVDVDDLDLSSDSPF